MINEDLPAVIRLSCVLSSRYDLSLDPEQMHNIYAGSPPALKAQLHAQLAAEYLCTGQACP